LYLNEFLAEKAKKLKFLVEKTEIWLDYPEHMCSSQYKYGFVVE